MCERLAALAGESAKLSVLDLRAQQSLREVETKARAQYFRIVLISPFQGGKSTIFNTLCGGRELSPTGFGLKTSAAVVEATYLESGDEYAEIEWRNNVELLEGILDPLVEHLVKFDPARFGNSQGKDITRILDLDNPKDRALLIKAQAEAEAAYLGNRANYPTEYIDMLEVGWLTLKHFESTRKLLARQRVSLEQATGWVRYPKDWTGRAKEDFKLSDVLFLFLRKVSFKLREPNLKTLRATIVDCPGLQASTYDNKTTRRLISQADAIIFLLGTNGRGMSLDYLDQVALFKQYDLGDRIFFGYNAVQTPEKVARELILPADLAQLAARGFRVPKERIAIFHALLAYRAKGYQLLHAGKMPEQTMRILSEHARDKIPPEQLPLKGKEDAKNVTFIIESDLQQSFATFLGRWIPEITPPLASEAERLSNWQTMIELAGRFITGQKAESILLNKGALLIRQTLDEAADGWLDREKAVAKNEKQLKAEQESAQARFDRFKREARPVQKRFIHKLENSAMQQLCDEVTKILDQAEDDLADELKKRIRGFDNAGKAGRKLADCANNFIGRKLAGWQNKVKHGDSKALKAIRKEIIRPANQEFRDLAKKVDMESTGMLKGLSINLDFEDGLDLSGVSELIERSFSESIANELGDMFEEMFGDIAIWLRNSYFDHISDSRQKMLVKVTGVAESAIEEASKAARKMIEKQMRRQAKRIDKKIDKALEELQQALQGRVEQREKDFKKTVKEREKIAAESARIRQEIIKPAQRRVDDFIAAARRSLKGER